MKKFLNLVFLLVAYHGFYSQPQQDNVKQVVETLFIGYECGGFSKI